MPLPDIKFAFNSSPAQRLAQAWSECACFFSAAARYIPLSQLIWLNSLDKSDATAAQSGDKQAQEKCHRLLIHEFTHWIDHVATISGAIMLENTFDALRAAASRSEPRFHEARRGTDALKRWKYADYYHEIEVPNDMHDAAMADHPWRYEFSLGQAFDSSGRPNPNDPILFTRFRTNGDDPVGRVPFSDVSLWELRAVAAESLYEILWIQSNPDIVDKHLRSADYKKRMLELLYLPSGLEYSVAAHCFANLVTTNDIVIAYREGANLAGLVLNLTDADLLALKVALPDSPFAPFHEAFLRKRDRGYIFWTLCLHAKGVWAADNKDWIEQTFAKAGLASPGDCMARAEEEMMMRAARATLIKADSPIENAVAERFRDLMMYGAGAVANGKPYHIENIPAVMLKASQTGQMPTVILGDDTLFSDCTNWQSDTFLREFVWWFEGTQTWEKWMDGFIGGCLPEPARI